MHYLGLVLHGWEWMGIAAGPEGPVRNVRAKEGQDAMLPTQGRIVCHRRVVWSLIIWHGPGPAPARDLPQAGPVVKVAAAALHNGCSCLPG